MRTLEHRVVTRIEQVRVQEPLRLAFEILEEAEMQLDVRLFEIVTRKVALGGQPHVAPREVRVPADVLDVIHALHVHRDALEAVGDLRTDGVQFDAADLLEVRSMVNSSPPTSVHAKPVTWPTWLVFSAMP